jgi:antibiotic biosynthesis monooxygenase (ABM) superfamily enzyme
VTWFALLPQIIILAHVIPTSLPFLANVALSTAIPVCMLTWVIMPALTRALRKWLYSSEVTS